MMAPVSMSTVRLSQPQHPQHFVPTQPAGFQGYPAQQHHAQQHLSPHPGGPSDYEQGLETGIGLRRQEPQPTMQQLQAHQISQQQLHRGQPQPHPRASSTVNGQQPHPQHQLQHPQHPHHMQPHTQQQQQQQVPQGYQPANGHVVSHTPQQLQSSPPPAGHHNPAHHFQPGQPQPGQPQPGVRARPPTLQVQTALSGSGVPVAPPFLSPAGAAHSNQMQHQQQQTMASSTRHGQLQHQQQYQQLQLQQQQQQMQMQQAGQPMTGSSFAQGGHQTGSGGGATQTGGPQGGPGPSSVAMMARAQQHSSGQGTDSRVDSSRGRGEKEEEEQYFVELIYEFLYKSGLHSTARALLAETSSSSTSNLLSPSAQTSSLSESPSSLHPGSPLPSSSGATASNTAANANHSRTKTGAQASSGNLQEALRGSPSANDERMKSPSSRKVDGVDGATLPSPESGTGGSVGVKEEGDLSNADAASRKSSGVSDGESAARRKANVRLREPMVDENGGATEKGQLLEWWSVFQDISRAQPTQSKAPSTDAEFYAASVASGQTPTSALVASQASIAGQPGQQRMMSVPGQQQQQIQQMAGGPQKRIVMAANNGVPTAQQWLVSRDGPVMSLQQQQMMAHKNAQMQRQQALSVQPALGPDGQPNPIQQRPPQQPMSQFAQPSGTDAQSQAQFAQQQQQHQATQAQLQQQQLQQQQLQHRQVQARNEAAQREHYQMLREKVSHSADLLGHSQEAISSYMGYPLPQLSSLAQQLQLQVTQHGLDRRPEGGEEPSSKRTRVEGPPEVSMEQQQQQAFRAMQNPAGSRIASGQQQQQSPYPDQDHHFSVQANGAPNPAASRQAYAMMMHRRASQQTAQAQAQAQGSPYAINGSMPPPATPNFAGSPQSVHQFDRPASQMSQHGGYAMSRSGSGGTDTYGATPGPGPNSTPRVPGGVLPGGDPQTPASVNGGKVTKTKAAAKKPKATAAGVASKKTPKSSGVPEPPSPMPHRPESSASQHQTHHEEPYQQSFQQQQQQQQADPYPAHQPEATQHQQQDDHSHLSLGPDLDFDASGIDFNLDGLDNFQYTADGADGLGAGAGEEFDFSNWMVDEEA